MLRPYRIATRERRPEIQGRLVLERKEGETILITLEDGRNIAIDVADLRYGKAKLGITAPPTIRVDRLEIAQRRKAGLVQP